MPRIVVVGAHGRTGLLIVRRLIERGDSVLATIRNPRHMADLVRAGAETVVLDLDRSTGPEFAAQFKGADAVIFAAGSASGESSAIDSRGVRKTLNAASKAGVRRYLAISSIGASTGMKLEGDWASEEMKDYYKHKRLAGKAIMASGLDWTILEPGELTDAKGTGKVTLSLETIPNRPVSRADVAAVAVAALDAPGARNRALQLTAGRTSIAAALKALE
ncbi:MAG TPA: NAD(P)-binding oxidoreductase [Devosia sp.]|nr:NAD(P)-binding oxidoreductase [Devosia sp.]